MIQMNAEYFDKLAARLAQHASHRLGAPVTFAHWQEDRRTGAQVPVFKVPQSHAQQARGLGLTVQS